MSTVEEEFRKEDDRSVDFAAAFETELVPPSLMTSDVILSVERLFGYMHASVYVDLWLRFWLSYGLTGTAHPVGREVGRALFDLSSNLAALLSHHQALI